VTMNTLMNLTETDLTQANYNNGHAESVINTRLSANTPKGLLAGSIVSASATAGAVEKCIGGGRPGNYPLGIVINNAVGYPFESSSGVASGKCPYLHGAGTVFSTDLYETFNQSSVALTYAAGDSLYCSRNGLLENSDETSNTIVVGIVLIAPSTSDPFMVVQLRI